ncbi:hypothetical protein [Stenotrophomonas sp. 24(2023)]|uniref:5'-methylthioadenosine/S-adenosylhomocysteine nucleosidase family protein n=1 Tax=Stenotrophomonas sp. 24(2023) TaxID=3068324 RepID=UPI0027E03916|nr:hypothetical protein [Stenotrophomonas sp. 24(2023)]WMJ70470.1 hypothetical protein Q9R17_05035 [Stenotrophomonas sp. 24(2023)]
MWGHVFWRARFSGRERVRCPPCPPIRTRMKFHVTLLWKTVLPLGAALHELCRPHGLFNRAGGRTFVRSLGGDFHLQDAPVVLAPTDRFHHALRDVRAALGIAENRFPYRHAFVLPGQSTGVNYAFHVHGQVLCTTVQLSMLDIDEQTDWGGLQKLASLHDLWELSRQILAITASGSMTPALAPSPQILPALHVQASGIPCEPVNERLASALTGHPGLNAGIVRTVLEKNQAHQLDDTLLLADKQGLAAYVPAHAPPDAARMNLKRFHNAAAMLELAAVTRYQLRGRQPVSADLAAAIGDPAASITGSISGQKIWSLLTREFALPALLARLNTAAAAPTAHAPPSTLPLPSRPPTMTTPSTRLLIITVTDVESRALRDALVQATGQEAVPLRIDNFTYRDFGMLGDFQVFHQISGMGSGGLDGSQESIRRSIEAIKPDAVLMVGIAFGTDRKKQPIGTLLVSGQIQSYELQRINNDGSIRLRGDKATASPAMLNWVQHAQLCWPQEAAKLKIGLILSGEKLIDNLDYRDAILAMAPEAIGGEMEGAGLYVAGRNANVQWLLVKAVCDWADGKKSTNKTQNQQQAAESAAAFTVHLLRENTVPRTRS